MDHSFVCAYESKIFGGIPVLLRSYQKGSTSVSCFKVFGRPRESRWLRRSFFLFSFFFFSNYHHHLHRATILINKAALTLHNLDLMRGDFAVLLL